MNHFNNHAAAQDQAYWDSVDCSGLLAIRILWKYYLQTKYPKLENLKVTKSIGPISDGNDFHDFLGK
jgi:hypothetical protein